MDKKPILTIAVTTYNRAKFLKTSVDACINQIESANLGEEVEILISNDASPDKDTPAYVIMVDEKYNFVRGYNQPKNIGVTKNLEWIVNESKGHYILLHGDDDILKDGAILAFVNTLKKWKPNFIIVNTDNIHSLDDSNQEYKVVLENRLKINKDIFVDDFDKEKDALKAANNWLYLTNFITSNIFKKELWQKEMSEALKYVKPKNVFLWQAPLVIGIKKYGKILLLSERLVLCRKNPTDNYVKDPRGLYYFNLYESIEISWLIKDFMPEEYKNHKKIYAAFITSAFITETSRGRGDIRKHALAAFYRYMDIFPENLQFLGFVISPTFITRFEPGLKKLKKLLK